MPPLAIPVLLLPDLDLPHVLLVQTRCSLCTVPPLLTPVGPRRSDREGEHQGREEHILGEGGGRGQSAKVIRVID